MKKYALFLLVIALFMVGLPYANSAVYAESDFTIDAKSGFLMDYHSGEVLFEKSADVKLPVASMVKLMTMLLVFEEVDGGNLSLSDKVTTTENASSMGGSQVFIDPFVQYAASDLIKSVVMASANDASVALAEHVSGSEEAFVKQMNSRAVKLGMKNTLYKNCTGLPAPEQYSCARDSAMLLFELLKHEVYHNYSTLWIDELVHPSGRKTELVNTNKLVRYYKGCDGGKTGSTNEAGFCLTSTAVKNDMRLISVIVGASTGKLRFDESALLFNYGFNNFENKHVVNKDLSFAKVNITKGKLSEVELFPAEDFFTISKKGTASNVEVKTELPERINAPQKAGDCLGKIYVHKNGKVIKEICIIVKEDIEAISFFDGLKKVASVW